MDCNFTKPDQNARRPSKIKRRWKFIALTAAFILVVIISYLWWRTQTPEYRLGRLTEDLRHWKEPSSGPEGWLAEVGWGRKRLLQDIFNDLIDLGPGAVPVLIQTLQDEDATLRSQAAIYLMFIRPPARQAVPALKNALQDPDITVRINAAYALGKISPAQQGKLAVDVLARALDSDDHTVKLWAVFTLAALGPTIDEVVPALVKAVKDEDILVRHSAIDALGAMGPAAQQALPALRQLKNNPDEAIRQAAAEALEKIEGKPDKNQQD
ncbi:HEAT repeat domain-containing protein [Planctomycetota bacterium]